MSANRIAKWDGSNWFTFGLGMDSTVTTITTSPTGTLYAGGIFTAADGNTQIQGIARWNLTQWVAMGTAVTSCYSIVVAPNAEVYAGGNINLPGLVAFENVAKWDGASWNALGSGVNNSVYALVLDSQLQPYVGGAFLFSNIINPLYFMGKWNGSAWQMLGSSVDDIVYDLTFDNQDNLYAGGKFDNLRNGQIGRGLGRWNGNTWSPVGGGVFHGDQTVYALAIQGNYLYVGGNFLQANGVPAQNIARFWINFIGQQRTLPSPPVPLTNTKPFTSDLYIFPNPFKNLVNIQVDIHEKNILKLDIYNLNGQLIQNLLQEEISEGRYTFHWNGHRANGARVPNGMYICKIQVGKQITTQKFVKSQ